MILFRSLIGEEIAGERNATALADAAKAFDGTYISYSGQESATPSSDRGLLIAAENAPGAECVYSYRPPVGTPWSLVVGNEAKGLRRPTLRQAHACVEVPVISKNINCLNVATAAAVVLYYLGLPKPLPYPKRTLSAVQRERPDLLLLGGSDAFELGSIIRSACAFGWDRLFLHDRCNAWYACDRVLRSEGRGAARRGRNPIRVMPGSTDMFAGYRRVVVCTSRSDAQPLHRVPMTGKDTLLVLPDERADTPAVAPGVFGGLEVVFAGLPSHSREGCRYHQTATIALAEAARQLGRPDSEGIYLRSRRDRFRRIAAREESGLLLNLTDLIDVPDMMRAP